jgi:membrane protein
MSRVDWPNLRRRGGPAAMRAAVRFARNAGGYHAAALTYYSIFALFPAAALVYSLLGIFGADEAIDDTTGALSERDFDEQYVDAVRETITSAVNQRSDEATLAVVISALAAIYIASRWVRGVARGMDAVFGRPYESGAVRFLRQLRDTVALVLLFVGALLLEFVGGSIASGVFGEAFILWEVTAYMLAAVAGACAYAYIYAFVLPPPRPPRDALATAAVVSMLGWIVTSVGFRIFAELWPGYDTNYGVFASLFVAMIWIWLTNVSVLLGGAFAAEWAEEVRPRPAQEARS